MDVAEDLLERALSLEINERARLAEKLLQSLDDLSDEEIEKLWLDEAERRIRDYRAGVVTAVPAHEVLTEAQRRLR